MLFVRTRRSGAFTGWTSSPCSRQPGRALDAKSRLRSIRADIREDGGTPPLLPPELTDVGPDTTDQ
ncbi:hypothetical protein ACIP88_26420 [Streptomyces uncialis]|uniref:hypothetical protein n=1 Tax=Streptomyces uncialis TaxID=1048205 RepID=UPI0037F2D332